ncbi:unknown [Bacteroides sp. CAG:20]|nr:unknown [Bacteroides sp. CAG:20]
MAARHDNHRLVEQPLLLQSFDKLPYCIICVIGSRQVIVQHLGHSRRKRNPFVLIGNDKRRVSRISNQLKETARTITASGYLPGYFLGTLLQKRIIAHPFLHSHSLFFREGLLIIQSVESESHSHTLLVPHDSFIRGHTYHATFFPTSLFQSLRQRRIPMIRETNTVCTVRYR